MTQDEIIRMAKEAGLEQVVSIDPKNGGIITKSLPPELLERFADLVAAHEREALAEQEKQEPVAFETWWKETGQETLYALNTLTDADAKILAEIAWNSAPVRTKDLTYDEIRDELNSTDDVNGERGWIRFALAVIAADRSKNGII